MKSPIIATILPLFILIAGCSLDISEDTIINSHEKKEADIITTSGPGIVQQYEKAEWIIKVKKMFSNPFERNQVKLNMVLKSGAEPEIVVPCYFDNTIGDTASQWIARFSPRKTGTYEYNFSLQENSSPVVTTAKQFITVGGSNKKGFLNLEPGNFWVFRADNGELFRGVGENVGWASQNDYESILTKLSANKANFFRTWMCNWNFALEWGAVPTDINNYYNKSEAVKLDILVEMAASREMYMMLVLEYHGHLMKSEWSNSRYNAAKGGPCTTPAEFFTNARAKEMFKNRLRYIIARWGYGRSIASWELFNEVDNMGYDNNAIKSWHEEMGQFLKDNDPYKHQVTTSINASVALYDALKAIPAIDFNQRHKYDLNLVYTMLANNADTKPFVMGECAYQYTEPIDNDPVLAEKMKFDFKRGLWYGLFNKTPIAPMSWFWQYFDSLNIYPYFKGVQSVNMRMLASSSNGSFSKATIALSGMPSTVQALGVSCGNDYYIYILNNSGTSQTFNISIGGVDANNYNISRFNPSTGEWLTNGVNLQNVSLENRTELIFTLNKK